MNDQSHASKVSVALSVYRGPLEGERPDAEELAALFEDRLPSGRKAEVLSHLANDGDLYSQWLAFFEYADEIGLSSHSAIDMRSSAQAEENRSIPPAKVNQAGKNGWIDKLKDFFNLYTLIPGAALAGVAAFILFFRVSTPMDTEARYRQYGAATGTRIELPTRSLGNFWADPAAERFVMSQGFKAGLERQGIDTAELKLLADEEEQPASDAFAERDLETLTSLGQWAALAQVQCPKQSPEYYEAASRVLDQLSAGLAAINTDYSKSLSEGLASVDSNQSDVGSRVCETASLISKDVRR